MYKEKRRIQSLCLYLWHNRVFKTMKISFILLFIGCLSISASTYSQEAAVSLEIKNKSISRVFEEIQKQTSYSFWFESSDLDVNKKVSVDVENESVENVLNSVLKDQNVDFSLKGNHILIFKKGTNMDVKSSQILAISQNRKISGHVTDDLGEPVIGASVVVRSTKEGTATDMDGNFTVNAKDGDIIDVSFMGYNKYSFKVGKEDQYTISLTENTQLLDEVVVVGYGVQKKANVIGSIAQVDSKKLENRSSPALTNALTGQMPGVTITQSTGQPGTSEGTIRVRGVGSFGATPDALVLIDGIPGSLSDVRSEDVENISVLKDASTAAIYGSRAANGVILVTTKAGRKSSGKIDVSYNGYVGYNEATALPKFIDSWEWATLYNQAKGGTPTYSTEEIQQMKDGSNPDKYANENYLKEILGNKGLQTGHDLTLNGGDEKNQYLVSLGVLSQDGIVEKNDFTRYNGRVNMVNQLASNLKMTTRLSGIYAKVNEPNIPGGDDGSRMTGIIQKALRFPGIYPTQLMNGEWGMGAENHGTPVSWLSTPSFYQNSRHALTANLNLEYKPIKDLTLNGLAAYRYTYQENREFKSTHKLEGDRIIGPSFFENSTYKTVYKSFQATADYSKSINKHNFGILGGYSWEEQRARGLSGSRDNFPSNDLPQINAGAASNMKNSGYTNEWAIQSYFGRLRYNYDERYLFEATVRYDGSSRFPNDDKYAFFPSAGIGWRLSEEGFIKNNSNLQWIDNLKLKASAGKLGNQNIGDYPYQSVYEFGYDYPFGGSLQQGAAVSTLVDPSLRWEETATYDVGFETILWRGLLSTDITYFHRKTTDILYAPGGSVSNVLGLQLSEMNTGELKNTGWEFELGHRNKIGKVNYNVGVNFSIINNEVLSLGVGNIEQLNGLVGNGSNLFIGYPMQMYYGYVADGVFLDDADIKSWHNQTAVTPNAKAGDIRYKDISGPDGKPDGVVDSKYDRTYLGSRIPKYTYGVSLGADYKGFDFSILFQGVSGVDGMLNDYAGFAFRSDKGNVQRWQADGAFDPENPTRYPRYPRLEVLSNVETPNIVTSSFWVRNASYLRIKTMQLGYTIPKNVLSKVKLGSARIYFQAENPVTWHDFPEGWDPEISTGGVYYPILKTFTFGLNLKF